MDKSIFKKYPLIFFSIGVINALPFVFENLSIISWFSFAPFIILLVKTASLKFSKKQTVICIFSFSFAYYFTIYHFFLALYPLSFIGMGKLLSLVVVLLAWIVLSLFHALELTIGTYIAFKLKCKEATRIFSIALMFLLIEFIQYVGPFSFPWVRVSLPQYNLLPLIQSASLFGPYFIDLILLICNALLTLAIITPKKVKFSCLYILLIVSNLLFGVLYINSNTTAKSTANVSLIQGNVLINDKWHGNSSYSTYLNMTKQLKEDADIVIWSETAIPLELNESKKVSRELIDYCKSNNTEMIVGAFYRDYYNRELNGTYYVNKNGISDKVYFKQKLVPFGEYLPFRKALDLIPFLSDINLYSSDLYPGKFSEVFATNSGNIGSLICFDSIFHTLARKSVNNGAELIAILTNDAWYKDFPAVYQHNAQAVWRAVENNRWVVRCANSGISSIITNKGKTISRLEPLVYGTITEKVSFIEEKSLYSIIGDIIILVPILFFLILFIKKCFCKAKALNK